MRVDDLIPKTESLIRLALVPRQPTPSSTIAFDAAASGVTSVESPTASSLAGDARSVFVNASAALHYVA